jgi:predicted molibdopterin-dependent oxidoreductase YjgC
LIHRRFESIRGTHGPGSVAGLGSATNTNEALFLMKKYFQGQADFRLSNETETYEQRQDDLLRRIDKHPNTHGALDLGLAGHLHGLQGLRKRAEAKQIRAMWIAFHPQLVGDDAPEVLENLEALIRALDYSVVSTTHEFPWTAAASVLLPMAAWAEETGTYTNYAGRTQITHRAVAPVGSALPLHSMMSAMLGLSGIAVSVDPSAIFEWMAQETKGYAGLTYTTLGALGSAIAGNGDLR